MIIVSSCSCLCPTHWSQMSSPEWRCSWRSADRRCSNYIWVMRHVNGLPIKKMKHPWIGTYSAGMKTLKKQQLRPKKLISAFLLKTILLPTKVHLYYRFDSSNNRVHIIWFYSYGNVTLHSNKRPLQDFQSGKWWPWALGFMKLLCA